jgi:hypothetical protein
MRFTKYKIVHKISFETTTCSFDWSRSPMVRRSSGTLPTRVQILVLAPFPGFSRIPVDDKAPLVTSRISRSVGAQSFGGANRGRVCIRVFIGVSVRACCERLRFTVQF